ncbi:Isoaspartyl peptidase/L-asparaginase [Branchiostoma belcheri]|nr:Isoaspartyl peptidase/L-asparaginase [Branchiostoma belcheri]
MAATATTPTIVVHGGAWSIPDDIAEASQAGVKTAAEAGYKVLTTSGGSALDAVETAVRILEDDVVFDAGTGSVLNSAGDVEMDAIIMDGQSLRAGSVACVQNIAHPISLARQVMEKTDHTMIAGVGANLFSKELGIPQVPTDQLVTDDARKQWEEYHKYKRAVNELFDSQLGHDTVGAVAVDSEGNVACATSTGGITAKRIGRVGDSPVIGCGAYADNETGAVSCTGHGEAIMSVTLARTVTFNMEQGASAQAAADKSIAYMKQRVDGTGGVIVVSREGQTGVSFNTRRMPWAVVRDGTIRFGMNPGENFQNEFTNSS